MLGGQEKNLIKATITRHDIEVNANGHCHLLILYGSPGKQEIKNTLDNAFFGQDYQIMQHLRTTKEYTITEDLIVKYGRETT